MNGAHHYTHLQGSLSDLLYHDQQDQPGSDIDVYLDQLIQVS